MGLKKRGAACMMFFGAALSFKLQTVFFLPVLLPLWLRKDIKLRHVLLIPVAYLGMMVPAFWGWQIAASCADGLHDAGGNV